IYDLAKDGRFGKLKEKGDVTFKVPNTVLAYWGANANFLGRVHVGWDGGINSLKARGFKVDVGGVNPLWSDSWPVQTFMQYVVAHTVDKSLYGLYLWGHGIGFASADGSELPPEQQFGMNLSARMSDPILGKGFAFLSKLSGGLPPDEFKLNWV